MAVARPAADRDRLPWLDTRVHRRRRDPRPLLIALFGVSAFAAVAGLSFWYGQRSLEDRPGWQEGEGSVSQELPPVMTLPRQAPPAAAEPPPAEPPKQAAPPPAPRAEPAAEPRPTQRRNRRILKSPSGIDQKSSRLAAVKSTQQPTAPAVRRVEHYSGYWPTPATAVRIGRMIQIGTYSNARRANAAWQKTARRYPQVAGLPRITSPYKDKYGRTYHRLQVMTAAPAQAQWLCRKMRADGRRCTVLGSRS